MGQTITEKIMSRVLGDTVFAGDENVFSPDLIVAYDYPGYIDLYAEQLKELGIEKIRDPEKFLLFIDHFNPAGSLKEVSVHAITRSFAKNNGIRLVEGRGIGHQVATELGYIVPGKFIVHFDGHASTMGALGALSMGISRAMIEAFATQSVSLVVPPTIKINFTGHLRKGVTARDLFHSLLKEIGPAGCRSCVVEYSGEGLKKLNMDERMTLCNLAMFVGGVTAIMEPDEVAFNYLKDHNINWNSEVYSDDNASYKDTFQFDLNQVEPILVAPPSPANTVSISDYIGTAVNAGYIGSCASGRITDLEQACEILEGKKIKEGFRLHIVPTSNEIQKKACELKILEKLIDAGAMVHAPTCDFCYGQLGILMDGEIALSTGTLNVPGRMGSDKALIYTSSPYTIAASAITGAIVDPRDFL